MYRMIGVYPSSHSNQNRISNCKKFLVFMLLVILFAASSAFTLFEAHSTSEYATALSASILTLTTVVFFLITMTQIKKIVKLIRKFEDFIKISEHSAKDYRLSTLFDCEFSFETGLSNPDSKAMYTEFNENFENFGKWIRIVVFDVSLAGSSTCIVLVCLINYYFLDMGEESFMLISPVMYAFYMHFEFVNSKNIHFIITLIFFLLFP